MAGSARRTVETDFMRETPYNRLKRVVQEYMTRVQLPMRKTMWMYPKEKLRETWRLDDLAERVQAADQLGFDVRLRMSDQGLVAEYVKRPGELGIWL